MAEQVNVAGQLVINVGNDGSVGFYTPNEYIGPGTPIGASYNPNLTVANVLALAGLTPPGGGAQPQDGGGAPPPPPTHPL